MQIPISNIIYPVEINRVTNVEAEINEFKIKEDKYDPANPNTTWPAVILAANRNDNVIGRTKVLKVSTKTKKGFNQLGAPPGRSCALAVHVS